MTMMAQSILLPFFRTLIDVASATFYSCQFAQATLLSLDTGTISIAFWKDPMSHDHLCKLSTAHYAPLRALKHIPSQATSFAALTFLGE